MFGINDFIIQNVFLSYLVCKEYIDLGKDYITIESYKEYFYNHGYNEKTIDSIIEKFSKKVFFTKSLGKLYFQPLFKNICHYKTFSLKNVGVEFLRYYLEETLPCCPYMVVSREMLLKSFLNEANLDRYFEIVFPKKDDHLTVGNYLYCLKAMGVVEYNKLEGEKGKYEVSFCEDHSY